MYYWAGLSLQEGATVIIELITTFHDHIIRLLTIILIIVSYLFVLVSTSHSLDKYVVESHTLELIWTILPIVLLLFMAFPSLYLLYLTEDRTSSRVVVKVVGHQWYWEYQYEISAFFKSFDSYIVPVSLTSSSSDGISLFRNLDVDNRLVLPAYLSSLLLVGSSDVLHSWTVPQLGVKVDAIPGRLNHLIITPSQTGVFYGQCSELCGTNHSFIPIVVEVLSYIHFSSFMLLSDLGGSKFIISTLGVEVLHWSSLSVSAFFENSFSGSFWKFVTFIY